LFHEQMFPDAGDVAEAAESLRGLLSPDVRVMAFGGHLLVYHPNLVRVIMEADVSFYGNEMEDAVRRAAETDAIGELLGFGVRLRSDGDVAINFRQGDRNIAGFIGREEDGDIYLAARAMDYAPVFGALEIDRFPLRKSRRGSES
jgi:hypothetical protein